MILSEIAYMLAVEIMLVYTRLRDLKIVALRIFGGAPTVGEKAVALELSLCSFFSFIETIFLGLCLKTQFTNRRRHFLS